MNWAGMRKRKGEKKTEDIPSNLIGRRGDVAVFRLGGLNGQDRGALWGGRRLASTQLVGARWRVDSRGWLPTRGRKSKDDVIRGEHGNAPMNTGKHPINQNSSTGLKLGLALPAREGSVKHDTE